MVCIELGLTEWEFWNTTPRKSFIIQLHNRRKNERQWEQTRYLASLIHNSAPGKKRNRSPRQMVPLSLDRKTEHKDITIEEAQEVCKLWKVPMGKPDKKK